MDSIILYNETFQLQIICLVSQKIKILEKIKLAEIANNFFEYETFDLMIRNSVKTLINNN